MADSPRVIELRREIAEMESNKAHLDPALYEVLHSTLLSDLAEEGATPEDPSPPARPLPVVVHRPGVRPAQPLPLIKPWAAAPEGQEAPMPKKYSPQQKLEALHKRLLAARKAGKPTHKLAHQIRACCADHGLAVPDEARLRQDRKTAAKPPATAPRASASPVAPAAERAEAPRALGAAQSPAPGAGEPQAPAPHMAFGRQMMREMGDLGAPPSAAFRLRALRSQALELLPELEDLSPEAAAKAHDEMDLLAQTLVLGGKLIARRTA